MIARLRVTLKNKADGALFSDSYVVRFARAARIQLRTGTDSPPPLVTPMMPGVELRMPEASVVDEDGKALEVESGTLVQTLDGDSFVPAGDSA